MTDTYSKTEVDAKLALAAERTGRATDRVEGKLDRVLESLIGLKESVHTDLTAVKADNRNTRNTISAVFIGTVIAALAALWATQANLLAAFQSGLTAHPAVEAAAAPAKTQ